MSVELEPTGQLSFQRPFTNGCTATLTITNREDATVAFKVKTTAPKQYCVRPNSGTVGPREDIKVQVILQPTTADWPLGYKCKDKFLVQSIKLLQSELDLPLADLWPAAEKDRKDQLQEHKLRCVYLDPITDSSATSAPALAVDNDALDASGNEPKSASASAYNMDSAADPVVVPTAAAGSRGVPVAPASVSMPPSPSKKLADAEPLPAYNPLLPVPAPATVIPLQQQLRTAESRIQSLEQQVAQLTNQLAAKTAQLQQHEVTLRQRSTASTSGGSAAAATQVITKTIVNPNTYSPQLVMIIAILSLLVGAIVF
ncbi:phosphatidylinositol-binding protein scs2 [Allomyces arbusculus]|nr:phosphatidylinositol-binding protein scs2 [Allomyces arbusculus]